MHAPARHSFVLSLAAMLVLAGACATLPVQPLPTQVAAPSSEASGLNGRLGTVALVGLHGERRGSLSATEAGVAVHLVIDLADIAVHPWGIYDQATCSMPPDNHDAPFTFADVEQGHHAEDLEAAGYLAYPANLYALVVSSDGSKVFACADLGPPATVGGLPSTAPCQPGAVVAPPPQELAFSREVLGNADVYLMDVHGREVRRLTTTIGLDIDPTWSPDGTRIAFRSTRDGQDEIYVMNADGTCQHDVSMTPEDDRAPAWSPDGTRIAFDHFFTGRFQDIAWVATGGGDLHRVTDMSGEYASWSPDGRKLAFASARDGDYEIYVIDADGTHERRLTDNHVYDMYPAWSPDGASIVYESMADSATLEIHVMRADGTGDVRLTKDAVEDRFPAWSRDGRLAWTRDGTIVVADRPGDPPTAVGSGQFPAWRP
jgi:WD40 repeat protein